MTDTEKLQTDDYELLKSGCLVKITGKDGSGWVRRSYINEIPPPGSRIWIHTDFGEMILLSVQETS